MCCNGDLFHVRCAAHIFNIIVKYGLLKIDDAIKNIRESIKYIRASQSRKEKFEDIVGELGMHRQSRPSLDVGTRWNSTCDMIESALPFKDAFYELGHHDPNYLHCPTHEEWEKVEVVRNLLKVFKKAIELVSGSKYPTSNLYFHEVWSIRQVLEKGRIKCKPYHCNHGSRNENQIPEVLDNIILDKLYTSYP